MNDYENTCDIVANLIYLAHFLPFTLNLNFASVSR